MANEFMEKRSEPRTVIDQYYSVEFSIGNEAFLYQFKIWDMSSKGMCLLIKEDSAVLKHLKVDDIINMKYHKIDSPKPGEYLKTKIRHITKDDEGRFKGHYKVGLLILEAPAS